MPEPGTYNLDSILLQLESDPENVDLINRAAIAYFQNPRPEHTGREALELFEKANALQKRVKTMHNLAWYLCFEWSEIQWRWEEKGAKERAMRLQEECLRLQPRSFYPYLQMGYMWLEEERYAEAILFLERATETCDWREVRHNLAYCRFQTGEYEVARAGFKDLAGTNDPEHGSLYNLAICEWLLGNKSEVLAIATKLESDIRYHIHSAITGYDIGNLYYLLGDFATATRCMLKQGIARIDLVDWIELSFALYKTAPKLWEENLRQAIGEREKWTAEVRSGHPNRSDMSEEDRAESLERWAPEIAAREKLLAEGMAPPVADPKNWAIAEYCGCLLFDCRQHGNPADDAPAEDRA